MSDSPGRKALFQGLVFDQEDQPAEVVSVGGEPCYVILDAGFRRHVEAAVIDQQVLAWLHERIMSNPELVTQGTMTLLGKEDLFTKAMIESSLQNMDSQMEQLMSQGIPEEIRAWLGMLGFRVVVDIHGEVVKISAPAGSDIEDW